MNKSLVGVDEWLGLGHTCPRSLQPHLVSRVETLLQPGPSSSPFKLSYLKGYMLNIQVNGNRMTTFYVGLTKECKHGGF